MFDDVPARIWLLAVLAALAWAPTRYVVRYFVESPSRHDIIQSSVDVSWRSSRILAKSLALLFALAAIAVFIFTPIATDVALSPSFLPLLMAGLGGFAFWSVVKGYSSGTIEPAIRGVSWEFNRDEHPKRYWASMAWNGLIGSFLVAFGYSEFVNAPIRALRDRCHDWENVWSAKEKLDACNALLAKRGEDRSDLIAARGSAYYKMKKYQQAGADYATAIQLDPLDASSQYNLGLVYQQLGRPERAIDSYSAAIRINPKDADTFTNRGLILLDMQRIDEAITDFSRAHELQPAHVKIMAARGVAYAWKNDVAKAEQDFNAVRKRDPSYPVLLHGEAILAMNSGDNLGTIRLLSEAIDRDPKNFWALSMRAKAYERMGEFEKMRADQDAVQTLEEID